MITEDKSPWQRGRHDYRMGRSLNENPFVQEPECTAWEQGWRLERYNNPRPHDAPCRDEDMEMLSPWDEPADGY